MSFHEKPAEILMLDDETYRIDLVRELFAPIGVYGTDFVPEFVQQAQRGQWRLILLDHDLSPELDAETGADAARLLGEPTGEAFRACSYTPVVVHSLNFHKIGDMMQALWGWEAPVVRIPFHRLPEFIDWLEMLMGETS